MHRFSLTGEKYKAQANFVPGVPFNGAEYIISTSRQNNPGLSSSFSQLLAKDGINLVYSDKYGGSGLSQVQKNNLAPRFGFAYQATRRLVIRGGYGIFFRAFENRGGSPSLGYNYPFPWAFCALFFCFSRTTGLRFSVTPYHRWTDSSAHLRSAAPIASTVLEPWHKATPRVEITSILTSIRGTFLFT
jgi:hypothetical protein